MSDIYRIAQWDAHFETDETRKRDTLRWLPMPNKHDGLGFRTVAAQRNAAELYAAWLLMLQLASKAKRGQRGRLVRDGHPLTAEDMAIMTGFPKEGFAKALTFFSQPKVSWIEIEPAPDQPAGSAVGSAGVSVDGDAEPSTSSVPAAQSAGAPATDAASPARREGNGKEEEGRRARPAEIPPELPTEAEIVSFGETAGIPPDYCRRYHAKTSETHSWVTQHNRLVDWRKRLPRYWAEDKPAWGKPRANGKPKADVNAPDFQPW